MQTILRYLLLLPLLLLAAWNSQAQILQESFESAPGTGTSKVNVAQTTNQRYPVATNEYFIRTSNATVGTDAPGFSPATGISGGTLDGAFYWAGEGVQGGSVLNQRDRTTPALLTLNPVNIAGYGTLKVVVGLASTRGTATGRFEQDDTLKIQVRFNGAGQWVTVGQFVGDNTGAVAGQGLWRQDTDLDGLSSDDLTAPVMGYPMSDFSFDVAGSGTTLETRIRVAQYQANEEFAIDNIRVTGVISTNPPPVIENLEPAPLVYTEGNPATNLSSTLTVRDDNHTTLVSAQVSFSLNYRSSEDVLLFTNQNGITGSYASGTGVLTLTGTASLANYQTALRSVQYQNTGGTNPSSIDRQLRFSVTDPGGEASTPVFRTLRVVPTLLEASMPYAEDLSTDGQGTRYTANSFVTGGVSAAAFTRTNAATYQAGGVTFTNISNSFYWYSAVTNSNTVAPANIGYFQTQPTNTAGYINLSFSVRLGARPGGFNLTDNLRISYRSNGGAWILLGQFRGTGSASNDNDPGDLKQDLDVTNIGAVPTGPALTAALTNYPFSLPATVNGTRIDFKIETRSDVADEQIAFDLLQLTGTLVVAPTVTTATPTGVTGTSAVLGGDVTADGGAAVTERGVVYSTTNTTPTTSNTKDTNGTGTGTFSETIGSLTPATTYYVRAYAINSVGTSYGAVQTFTTPTSIVSIVRAVGSTNPTNASQVSFTVTFANPVTGLTTANFGLATTGALTGASITSVSGSGTTYTVTVNTGSNSGTLQVQLLNATNLTPAVTGLPYTSGESYTIDKTAPTVAISSSAGSSGSTTTTLPIPFTVTFSENVSGFVAGDVTVTNGSITGSVSGTSPGTTYTFNVTPSAGGAVTVNVPANVAQDAAGNGNSAASQFSITYSPPNTTVVSVTRLTPSPTATATVSYRVTFAGSVTGLTTANFGLATTGALTGASIASVSGSGTTYTVAVNTGTGNGTLRLNMSNSTGITPTVTNTPYTTGEVYTLVKSFAAAPQLSLRGAGSASGTNNDVTAFVDLVQVVQSGTGTAVANGLQNSSFESNNVPANSFLYQQNGVVAAPWTFGPQAGVSRNGSPFGSVAPTSGGNAVALLQSALGNNGSIAQNLAVPTGSYQVSFEAIQRTNQASDQVVSVFLVEGGNDVFLGTFQPNSNTYTTFTSAAFSVTAPALTATVNSSAGASGGTTSTTPIPFTVTFSPGMVTPFTALNVTVTGGVLTTGSFAGSGSGPYTFTVTPSVPGTATTVSVAAGVAQDANNTLNTASNAYSITYNEPLPVELVRFTAELRNNDVLLQWATAQELNNDYFEVESSVDGRTFRAVGRLAGHGTSSQPHAYQLTDVNVARYARAVVYYRLRQVDRDGTSSLSPVQTVQVPSVAPPLTAVVFPNPAADHLTVRLSGLYTGKAQGWLFDAQGRIVQELSHPLAAAAGSDINLSVAQLPIGVYTLRLILDGKVLHRQIVVQR